MRLLFPFILLITVTVRGQTTIFDINKLDSTNFRKFISSKDVIVIGEMHGTKEVPLFVLQLIKQLRENRSNLTVGLEIPSNHQKDMDGFLKTGDFEKLLKLEYFKYPDGRKSVAMGELIKGIRNIKRVKVICFDIDTSLNSEINRDSLMGVNLSNGYKDGKMVVLTGNLHATLKEGYWRPDFKSAVFHFNKIRGFGDKLISLNTYYAGGTIWNCMQDGCKERDAGTNGGNFKQRFGLDNLVAIYDNVDPSGYNGFVYFDKVTASKPMVE